MSYGTPAPNPNASQYGIYMNYGTSNIPFSVSLPDAVLFNEQDCKDAFQALVDVLSQASGFTVQTASRSYPTTEDVTPTP